MESNAAKQVVMQGLGRRRENRLSDIAAMKFHEEDMEAIGVIAGKHEAERKAQEDAQRRIHERFAAEQQRIQQREEDLRLQEEAYQAERAECRVGLRKAALVAGVLCGIGTLYMIGAWRPEVAMTTGGLFILGGLTVIGLGLIGWRSL